MQRAAIFLNKGFYSGIVLAIRGACSDDLAGEVAAAIFKDVYYCAMVNKISTIESFFKNNPFGPVMLSQHMSKGFKEDHLWPARLYLDHWDFDVVQLFLENTAERKTWGSSLFYYV